MIRWGLVAEHELEELADRAHVPGWLQAALLAEGLNPNPQRDSAAWLAEFGERAEATILMRQARGGVTGC